MTYEPLTTLAAEFWQWRLATSFRTSDDIPRVDHAPGWVPDFTPESITARRDVHAEFAARWAALDVSGLPVPDQVDYRLLGSALNRVSWELDELRNWERDAVFLTGQVLGPWFDLLVELPPFSSERQAGLLAIVTGIPDRLALAQANLSRAGVGDLARVAAGLLADIEAQFTASVEGLRDYVDGAVFAGLVAATPAATSALARFGAWLGENADSMAVSVPVGRERFVWFLRNVALVAEEPEDLVRAARQDYRRAVMAETVTANRTRNLVPQTTFGSAHEQVEREAAQEQQVRDFSEREGLLSQPETLGKYLIAPMPPYLDSLSWLGVTDDLTGDDRLDADGVSYCPVPSADLPYFYIANARDPRLGIVHEGAHYKQLALGWRHPNPIRRRYYDSVANEGIAFYNEEMMLLAGLFADAPLSERVIHNFNRLRSLRVIADVNLATGVFSLEDSVRHFVDLVPMDLETATEESAMYVATPGLAMSYHVGKMQLLRLMTDAIVASGDAFSLRDFHDFVWLNGNVPFSLQRWELLGDRSDVDVLDAATA